ncbi:MAG: alpha-mannosidase, partial [Candidatus Hydrogenedentes bacterium]|nr:alpha-mannosidase [Candidatus Hydrogenedentota bacterium]
DSPRVEFVTHVDWWEKRTLLKVAFPVDVRATRATAEIQYGVIERPTHRNTAYDRGRFEASCQRWIDLSEGNYGVSLLNDSKYSYDAHGNVLRLSLLRSPVDPDPHADEGEHQFTYALYPHSGGWRQGAVHQGLELNYPLVAREAENKTGPLSSVHAFAQVDVENVIVDAVKRHEDSNALIVRLYEAHGQRGAVNLSFSRVPKGVVECDCMEENDAPVRLNGDTVMFEISPFELRTFKVDF